MESSDAVNFIKDVKRIAPNIFMSNSDELDTFRPKDGIKCSKIRCDRNCTRKLRRKLTPKQLEAT